MNFFSTKIFKKTPFVLLCLFLILLPLISRIIKLITQEDYFGGDFAFYYFLTKSIVVDRQFPLIGHVVGDIGGFAQGVGWNYLLAIPFAITDGHPFGAKVLMFCIDILTIVIASVFAWRILGKKEAIFLTFFLGFSPNLINWSSSVWPPYVIPLLAVLYVCFLIIFLQKIKVKYFFYATVALGLMIHFEIASFALILPSYLALAMYFTFKHIIKLKNLLVITGIFLLLLVPYIIYDLSYNFYNLRGVFALLNLDKSNNAYSFLPILLNRQHIFKTDLLTVFPTVSFKLVTFFLLYIITCAFLYLKDKKVKKWGKIFLLYTFIIIVSTVLFLIIFPSPKIPFWWFTYLTIFYIFSTSIICSYLWNKKIIFHKFFISLFIILFINSATGKFLVMLQKEQSIKNTKYVIKIQEPIEYIYSNSDNKPFKIIYATGQKKVLDYTYMFWYVGNTKYRNSPGFKQLDFSFTRFGGIPVTIDEATQFKNLSPGLYYIIITAESIQNGYASQLLDKNKYGHIIETKKLGDNFVVKKLCVEKC